MKIFQSTIFRIIAIIIVLVLPINIMTLILSNMVLEKSKEQMVKDVWNTLEWNGTNFENVMKAASKRLTYLSISDSDFISLAKSTENQSRSERGMSLSHVTQTLKSVQLEYPWLDLMYFYFPSVDYLVCNGYPGIPYNACRDRIREVVGGEDTEVRRETDEIDDVNILLSSNSWNDSCFGVIVNLERLLARFNFGEDTEGRSIFFTNTTETFYTSQGSRLLEEQQMTLEDMRTSGRYEVFSIAIAESDLVLVEVVEWEKQIQNLPFTISILQALSVLLTISVIPLLLIYVRKWMVQPLNRLMRAIRKIEQGELDYRIESIKEGREFEQINHSFNHMMDQVKELKIDVYEKELERKNIKMRYLSQQVQSHFILNIMNILYSYEPEEYPLIQKLILCISKYFRYIVRAEDEFVQLKQEMDHIQNYFEIQKARYPGLFYAIIEYEEELGNALVPPLLIQNFAENAIKHSLKIGNKITIFVIAEYHEEADGVKKLRIRLADTGDGISDEMIEKIEIFRKTGEVQDGMGVGIRNAIERLEYLYTEETTLRIWRDENYSGTNVEIILPIHHADDQEGKGYYEGFINRR